MIFGENYIKKDVKNVSEISEVTINKCHKKLEKMTDTLIPAVIIKKYGGSSSVTVVAPMQQAVEAH